MNSSFSVIGCEHGHIGEFIGQMLALGHPCAGLYEPRNVELARQIAERHQIPLVDGIEDCLGPAVEFVGSAAINNEKIGIVELCEARGKHVMVDKPAVTDADGLERLTQVVRRGKTYVGMMLTSRFMPALQTLKRLTDSGVLGEPVSFATLKPHRLNPQARPPWHFSKEQSGGIIVDLLVHDFDLLRWLTGREVESCQGTIVKSTLPEYPGFYDSASVQAVTEGGIVANLYTDWHTPGRSWTWGDCRVFLTGTAGKAELRLSGDPLVADEELLLVVTGDRELTRCPLDPAPFNLAEDFVAGARGVTANPLISPADVLAASAAAVEADRLARRVVRC